MKLIEMETKICQRSLNQLYTNCIGLNCMACKLIINDEYYCSDLRS